MQMDITRFDRRKPWVENTFQYILLILFCILFIFPTVFLIVSSLKQDEIQIIKDMSSLRAFLPVGDIGFQNYFDVFNRMNFLRFFMNSMIITGSTIVIGTFFNSMFAYSLAKLEFKAKRILLPITIALIIIPVEAIALPQLLLVNQMGLVDTYTAQIIPFAAEPFFIFLFYQFFRGLPKDFMEAAVIDGSSYFGIYWRIILPLSKPVIASVIIFNALWRWGDLLWPILVTRGESVRPLPLAMQQLFTIEPKAWGDIFAFAAMITVPILILLLLFQKQFIRSIASTGVKG